jgi:16S rRNA (adenine1518-N6/adenine1519-N6)-dimethyltransferase
MPPSGDADDGGHAAHDEAPPRLPPTRKSLGQHFLNDRRVLARIADALELDGQETVLEIGPGRGALTDLLLRRAGRVVAIEYDRALAALLRTRYATQHNVEIIEADVLDVSLGEVARGPYVLVGNVPYYITTPILFHALQPPRPARAVYLVQREVAERLAAAPGAEAYGALSVNVQAVATVEMLFGVPPGAFQPPPTVDSAVVRVVPRAAPVVSPGEERALRVLVQSAFAMRRKQMRRVLRSIAGVDAAAAERVLASIGIDPTARPEVISPAQFAGILRALAAERHDAR